MNETCTQLRLIRPAGLNTIVLRLSAIPANTFDIAAVSAGGSTLKKSAPVSPAAKRKNGNDTIINLYNAYGLFS